MAPAGLGRGEGWPKAHPQAVPAPLGTMSRSRAGPSPYTAHRWCPRLIFHLRHLAARAARLCHVAHTDGLPALGSGIWVIRVYVLTGINTKVAVTGTYFQVQRTAGRCAGKMPQQRPGHAPRLGAGWGVPPDRACPAPGRLLTPLLHLQCSEPQAAASRVNRGFLRRWTCSVKHNSSTSSAVS